MIAGWLPRLAGLSIGVLAAVIAGATFRSSAVKPVTVGPAVLSECDGAIGWVAIHYVGGMDFATPTYRAFLSALPLEVKVTLVCPRPADRDELLANIGQPAGRFDVVLTGHAMTGWSRDRWVTLAPAKPGGVVTLVPPTEELAEDVWPARAGDGRLAFDLAAANHPRCVARRSLLNFDGGDFLSDSRTVFVSPAVVERNLHTTVSSEAELLDELRPMLGRKIVLLRNAPPHHVGMYMAIAGGGVAVVGDPSLGRKLLTPSPDTPGEGGGEGSASIEESSTNNTNLQESNSASVKIRVFRGLPSPLAEEPSPCPLPAYRERVPVASINPDGSPATQKQFDDVAAQVAAAGYRVVRIPTVVAPDGKTYLTFVNGLIDQRLGGRTVYLPTYAGQDALNQAAVETWEGMGYRIVPIDCTKVFPRFGTLHCLVNVLERT